MNCEHCGAQLQEVYTLSNLYVNYRVEEINGKSTGVWTGSEEGDLSDGPFCYLCGHIVNLPLTDDGRAS